MTYLPPSLRARWFGARCRDFVVKAKPLAGGLEAAAVHLVTVARRGRTFRRVYRYVHKVGRGFAAREAAIYTELVQRHRLRFAPAVLAIEHPAPGTAIMCIEAVQPHHRWPWPRLDSTGAVIDQLAALHELPRPASAGSPASAALRSWDYDAELERRTRETLALIRGLATRRGTSALVRNAIPPAESFAEQLPRVRRELLAARPFGACIIHGDVHPGNVLERAPGDPVLIDWARTREGSPLEDVSSWLQTLAYWEPEVLRRHDTLLVRYLAARGFAPRLTSEVRDLYWLAAASNALSGALAYHLAVASTNASAVQAERSAASARHWIRILRRARASLG